MKVESNCGTFVSVCAAEAGRMDEALRYARQCVDVCEKAARTHPDSPLFVTKFLAASLFNLAMLELGAGRPEAALRLAKRASEVEEKALVAHPQLSEPRGHLIRSLLLRGVILLQSGRAADASDVAEEAAKRIAVGSGDFPGNERFMHGAVEGLFYALGRPHESGRPAEPPGLKEHADRAVAEAREACRFGFRILQAIAMLNELIGRPTAMQVLLMDQLFPLDPIEPAPGSDDDGPRSGARGNKP